MLCNRFRQIPGDVCAPTAESKKLLSLQTLPCKSNEQDSGYRVRSVSLLLVFLVVDFNTVFCLQHSTGLTIFLAILIVVASVVAASIVLYLWLKCRTRNLA